MARLLDTEPATLAQLREMLGASRGAPSNFSVAVEALVFDRHGRWVLLERGADAQDEHGKLEGIGGRVDADGSLRAELLREIREEVGENAQIEIARFVEVKSDAVVVERNGEITTNNWIIVSYLCRWTGGDLELMEPAKNSGFVFIESLHVDPERLSSSGRQSLKSLQSLGQELRSILDGEDS
jgi:ADP-ribose pyrophosphatase YjhB (NUDIX family)